MVFEAPEETHFEGPLRSPHLDEKADREYDRMLDQGLAVPSTAWESVTRTHGTVGQSGDEPEDESDLPIAGPPKPGETDEEIRQRHREALRSRDNSTPPNFDPELNRQMLERAKRGDFSLPESDSSNVK